MEKESEIFRENGKTVVEWISTYWNGFRSGEELPLANHHPGDLFEQLLQLSPEPPQFPETFDQVMLDLNQLILPKTTHWMSNNFHAYFPSGNSAASLQADMISGAINAIGFSWVSNPSGTELEMFVVDWLGKMIGLPKEFQFASGQNGGAVIIGSASEATLLAVLAAREKVIERHPHENPFVVMSKLVGYTSKEAHSSVRRAGLLSRMTMRVVAIERKNHRMDPKALEKIILKDVENGFIPFFACATLGTTGVCAFDSLADIGPICQRFKMWLHVDAAYGGNAMICPEYQHLMEGISLVDSIVVSPHKWMMVNYDCSVMWLKNTKELTVPFLTEPEYLKALGSSCNEMVPDFRHFGVSCGRRFRALKLWFVIRMHGVCGLQENIRLQIQHGNHFAKLLVLDPRFQLVSNSMGVVGFRLKGKNELTERMLNELNLAGRIKVIHTRIGGKFLIRFVASGTRSCEKDVIFAWNNIRECADRCLHQCVQTGVDQPRGSNRKARKCSSSRGTTQTKSKTANSQKTQILYTDDDD